MSAAQGKRRPRPAPKHFVQKRTISPKREKGIELEHLLAKELGRYSGEWVAVGGHEVIGHAKTPEKLDKQLASRKPSQPYRTFRVATGAGATLF